MTISIWIAGAVGVVATTAHIASILIVVRRSRMARRPVDRPRDAPAISLIRPVCGIDNYVEDTLRSAFHLDYPRYEIVLCVALPSDPVVPLVERLIAAYPQVPARLLAGNDSISDNPKLNNVYKGWRAAQHDWIVMADSNVLMPRDYLWHLLCLARRHRARRLAAHRLPARRLLGRARMRVPQQPSGALAADRRPHRAGLRARQVDALSPQHHR
jgi:ceramide glucosyltransferase